MRAWVIRGIGISLLVCILIVSLREGTSEAAALDIPASPQVTPQSHPAHPQHRRIVPGMRRSISGTHGRMTEKDSSAAQRTAPTPSLSNAVAPPSGQNKANPTNPFARRAMPHNADLPAASSPSGAHRQMYTSTPTTNFGAYHGNTASKIFHNSTCRYYNCQQCTARFSSPDEALRAGYSACKHCMRNEAREQP